MASSFQLLLLKAMNRFGDRFIPARQRLAWKVKIAQLREIVEPEWNVLEKVSGRGELAIDIGANFGLYTYRLVEFFDRVISFEVNPDVAEPIRQWQHPRVELITKGLSAATEEMTLYTPIRNGVRLVGWASFQPSRMPDADQTEERTVSVVPLDSMDLQGVGFIKIDVEGHELAVLQGARTTLSTNRPRLLIEAQKSTLPDVTQLLADLGYRDVSGQIEGTSADSYNRLFVAD